MVLSRARCLNGCGVRGAHPTCSHVADQTADSLPACTRIFQRQLLNHRPQLQFFSRPPCIAPCGSTAYLSFRPPLTRPSSHIHAIVANPPALARHYPSRYDSGSALPTHTSRHHGAHSTASTPPSTPPSAPTSLLLPRRCGEQPPALLSTTRNAATIFSRKSANIPLRTLTSSSRRHRRPSDSASDDDRPYDEKRSGSRERLRLSASDDDDGSDFSLWSDTGDLVDQLADEEDPLSVRLRNLEEDSRGQHRRGRGEKKRVRYASANGQTHPEREKSQQQPGVVKRKEDIAIPTPPPQRLNWGQKALALVMAPGDGPSRMHGLHGQKLIYFLSVFVSLGVFLFGYDQGVMSGIITGPYFRDYFNQPGSAEIGTMVAILEIGAFIASLSVGRIGDVLGRRKTIFYGAVVFVLGGACQTFATGMPMMMVGRLVAGLGVGALSTIVPVYQSEISPPHNRGKLACIEFSGNIFGYMCSVWVDYFCTYIESDWAWRLPLLMQVAMGALLAVGSFLIVESPRYACTSGCVVGNADGPADGSSTTTTTKKASWSSPISTARATSTTRRPATNTVRSR